MGRFKSLTILLTLVSWGATTDGAPPDDAAPQARPTLPPGVQAGDYVRAVAKLCDEGKHEQAKSYLKAANDFRPMLTAEESATLDQYNQLLDPGTAAPVQDPSQAAPTAAPIPGASAGSPRDRASALVAAARQALNAGQPEEARRLARQADSLSAPFAPDEDSPARVLADVARATGGRGLSNNDKQQAAFLLLQAREAIGNRQPDEAARLLAQAKSMNVKWTLFDDTPAKVEEDLARLRSEAGVPGQAAPKGDRSQAVARIKEARDCLDRGDYARAEVIAREVASWNVHFGLIGDNPKKILAACDAIRRRDAARGAGSSVQTSEEFYNSLVAQARNYMMSGDFNKAEESARRALTMSVVPPVTADRAETVLQEIAMYRARGGAAPGLPAAEVPSAVAEGQANELLAQNQVEAARAKFEEAERLRAQEMGLPAATPIGLVQSPASPDQALMRTDGALPEPAALAPSPEGPIDDPAAPAQVPAELSATPDAAPLGAGDALQQSQALLAAGNYRAAKQAAQQAKDAGAGLEADNLLAQIAQSQQQAALQLYTSALDSIRKHEHDRARAILTELAYGDLDEATAQKVQDLLVKLPAEGAGHAAVGVGNVGTADDVEAVKAQQLNAEVSTKVADAQTLIETDPQKAIDLLQQQLASVKAAGLSDAVTRTMVRRIEVAIELAKKDKVVFDQKMQDKTYREEIERKRLRIIEADKAKKEQVKQFMEKAQEAQARADWLEAEKYARMAAQVDPNEIAATTLAYVANVKRHYERDKQIRADSNESRLDMWQDVEASAIVSKKVINDGIDPGEGFAELTGRRRDLAARLAANYKSAEVIEIEKTLGKTITLPNSDRMSLGEAIRYISEYTGLNIIAEHAALNEEGVTLESQVNIQAVQNLKLRSVLKYMLGPLHLSWTIDPDGVLVITSHQAKKKAMVTRVYSVADLVMSPLSRNERAKKAQGTGFLPAPGMAANPNDPNVLQAQADAMEGQGGVPIPGVNGNGSYALDREKPEFEPLMQLITSSIAPGTWSRSRTSFEEMSAFGQGAGGGGGFGEAGEDEGVGSITPFFLNISLIIRQTAEVHDEIVDLLRQLRRLQDLQVSIEVRFITVSDSFFEQIGVDFDFGIQSDAVGRKSSFAIPNPAVFPFNGQTGGATGTTGTTATTASAPYLINPARDHSLGRQPLVVGTNSSTTNLLTPAFSPNLEIPFVQDTVDNALGVFNSVPNLGGTFGIAFLSDLEVYLFMQAMQGDIRSNLVQAPKVTTFNGAPASVASFTGRNFVSSLTPIIGAGAVAFQPQVSTFPDGVQLFVTPVVSADRRYVRMSLAPVFTTFLGFDRFPVPAAVGGGGLGGQASSVNGQIQLPIFTFTNVNTTVTVPDGGTVLLGGVKTLREERRELGVPILAKTPLIDRLFRNIGIGRQTTSLMLMVTPRIIILEEEEERLGIPAIQNVTF